MPRYTDILTRTARRILFLLSIKILLVLILGAKMYQLQVFQEKHYKNLAENNRKKTRFIPASRGKLLDCKGRPLAFNKNTFRLSVFVDSPQDLVKIIESLSSVVDLSHLDQDLLLASLKKIPYHLVPILLKSSLSWEEVALLEVRRDDFPGLVIESGHTRYYPYKVKTAHILGYVGNPTKDDGLLEHQIARMPGLKVGKLGIERALEAKLKGSGGALYSEVNAARKVIRELETKSPVAGKDFFLSVNVDLQNYITKRFEREHTSCLLYTSLAGMPPRRM